MNIYWTNMNVPPAHCVYVRFWMKYRYLSLFQCLLIKFSQISSFLTRLSHQCVANISDVKYGLKCCFFCCLIIGLCWSSCSDTSLRRVFGNELSSTFSRRMGFNRRRRKKTIGGRHRKWSPLDSPCLASRVGAGTETVHRILTGDLCMWKVCERWVPRLLRTD